MTNDTHANQTPPAGRKGGDRKAGSPVPDGDIGAGILELSQSVDGTEGCESRSLVAAPVPFDFQGKAIRTITKDGEIWFVAADVCAVLEHTDPSKAVVRLDDDEKGATTVRTLGGDQTMNVVTESGLYSLVFTSRKPEAKAFRRSVTGVVLPTLRRTGKFDTEGEPNRSTADRDQTENGTGITVTLPGPGRYLVGLFHDGERRIEPLYFSDAISALTALDCRSIAYSHLTAASLWEKLQHLRMSKTDVSGGFTMEKLNATMQAGAELARQILYTYDEPRLIPRPPAKAAAE
ncbi:BRO family protein [Acidisphaera sp. S103]|uniref:BRO-N domain-containing protein n=1 Tax=Acidisphaera sp. S103 TaxID=1747223 RepID=UPI00131CEBB6|nr:BRO family protein [Acidisphaera sp. S103]